MSNALGTLSAIGRSSSVKLASIGFLILVLLLPTAMIESVIDERAALAAHAREDIMRAWGRQQSLIGPVLVIPYTADIQRSDGRAAVRTGFVYHLPESLDANLDVDAQLRYRGLYTVPVYTTAVKLSATFTPVPIAALGLTHATVHFDQARLAIGLSDPRTLRETPEVSIGDTTIRFAAGAYQTNLLGPHIVAPLTLVDLTESRGAFAMNSRFHLAGSDTLTLAPVADTNTISMEGNWPGPSFQGNYLPTDREILDDGFVANWQVTSLGRSYPTSWLDDAVTDQTLHSSLFGTQLKTPLSTYQMAKRAVRYAILAIGLSFACFFLFDTVSALHLHPVQYLLIGFANCLFFLLLLTLSEHIAFLPAYLISALACTTLIGGYSAAVLHARRRAAVCVAALVALYGFLFMTLRAQSLALLAGSVGLWLVLGTVMYLTRRVDWHVGASTPADGELSR
ncbi:MAG: cell envelope integrity protein CreD [Gammaproteobacteria bacterium]